MRSIIVVVILSFFAEGALAQQPNLINRLVTTVRHDTLDQNQIVFTDAETGQLTKFFLPTGLRPASLVAMDRNGDVWIDDLDSILLYRISGVDGSVQAIVNPGNRATYMVTDAQANLVVGHANTLTGLQAKVFVDRYSSAGNYIDGVDLTTLFPLGVFRPLQYAAQTAPPTAFVGGVARILVTRSGALWVGVLNAGYHPIIRLNPNLTLAGSYGLYPPMAMVPDNDEGLWVFHNSGHYSTYYPISSTVIAGITGFGWVHLSGPGQVLDINTDGVAGGAGGLTHSIGHRRYDGRQFQYPFPGATYSPGQIRVGRPENESGTNNWFPYADRIDYSMVGPTFFGSYYGYMSGFFLDGAQRVWALRNSYGGGVASFAEKLWTRFPVEPPYAPAALSINIGQVCRQGTSIPTSWYWSTYWGNASLFEYVHYTDPNGDLDGDGVSNRVELANFSNPLLPYGFSPVATATSSGGAPGTTFTVNYSVPGDQGLAYAAPFSLMPAVLNVGGGLFLPIPLTDPLVQLSLQPGASGLTGTLGVLDGQGAATATLQIPPDPWLSGYALFSCIVTRDPNLPLPLKTVSPPFQFTIP